MKLVLASSLLSVLCFPEEAAAFTAARPKIAALRSSSNTPQTNIVALQAVANANDLPIPPPPTGFVRMEDSTYLGQDEDEEDEDIEVEVQEAPRQDAQVVSLDQFRKN